MKPLVTVIIPNYNHGPYLEHRLRSVLDQTLTDFEVLFMDDASTDDSLSVFGRFADDPRIRPPMVNAQNTGSPFRQWNRGVAAARGRYIWIAESDDVAAPTLLERVVGMLDAHRDCGIGCCESWLLRGDGPPVSHQLEPVDRPPARREVWHHDCVTKGREVCVRDLLHANPMPNASAVVFRRDLYHEVGGADTSMRLCGDWMLWTQMLLRTDLAHVGDRLNYYRTHAGTVRQKNHASKHTFAEVYRIMRTICDEVDVPQDQREAALDWRMNWLLHELKLDGASPRRAIDVVRLSKVVDPAPHRRFARLASRRVGGRVARPVRRTVRQAKFFGRAVRGDHRERHELLARARGKRDALHWSRWARRQTRPVILVGMIEHMGDIIACEPVARHLRREHPDATIAWAVKPAYRSLVEHHPDVNQVVPSTCLTHWMMLRAAGGFDRIVDLHVHGRSCDDCIVHLPNDRHTGSVTAENYYHHGPLLHGACALAGLPRLDETPRLHIPAAVRDRVSRLGLPPVYAVIHGRSNQLARDWDPAKWPRLVRQLRDDAGLPVVEVGLDPVAVGACWNLCGRLSLLETAEVIRRASLFIGIDSGPAHMANAVGTPGVVLLGQYANYDHYLPYTGRFADERRARIIHWPEPARAIPVDHVFEQAMALRSAKKSGVPEVAA